MLPSMDQPFIMLITKQNWVPMYGYLTNMDQIVRLTLDFLTTAAAEKLTFDRNFKMNTKTYFIHKKGSRRVDKFEND